MGPLCFEAGHISQPPRISCFQELQGLRKWWHFGCPTWMPDVLTLKKPSKKRNRQSKGNKKNDPTKAVFGGLICRPLPQIVSLILAWCLDRKMPNHGQISLASNYTGIFRNAQPIPPCYTDKFQVCELGNSQYLFKSHTYTLLSSCPSKNSTHFAPFFTFGPGAPDSIVWIFHTHWCWHWSWSHLLSVGRAQGSKWKFIMSPSIHCS